MLDIKEVIKGLQIERECVSRNCDRECGKCDLVQERDWLLAVYDGALELLKRQEAKQPVHVHEKFLSFCIYCDPNGWNKEPCVINKYKCPRCEKYIIKGTKFCSHCGQEVKWK